MLQRRLGVAEVLGSVVTDGVEARARAFPSPQPSPQGRGSKVLSSLNDNSERKTSGAFTFLRNHRSPFSEQNESSCS